MENKTEIIEVQNRPQDLIRAAIDKGGVDLEKLEKLMELQMKFDSNEARKAYHEAITAFKKNPPKIKKDKKVNFGQTKYNHASLANVTDSINTELSKHGLSASWQTHQNGQISVTCKITHVKGHSEETTLSAPADTSGSKNAIQAIGSAISYLQRYTLLSLAGLATSEMDDDGVAGGGSPVTLDEAAMIKKLVDEAGIGEGLGADERKQVIVEWFNDMLGYALPKGYVSIRQEDSVRVRRAHA